jgi:hypothetical protein
VSTRSPYKRPTKLEVDDNARRVGDTIMVGSTRWVIRTITGEAVELEASNVSPGIWWSTTLDHLPEKLS